jgi:hypothetical protein
MTMRIIATKITSKELEPGDLFSTANQFYWDHHDPESVGERVYIRTEAPCPPDQVDVPIFRITVDHGDGT